MADFSVSDLQAGVIRSVTLRAIGPCVLSQSQGPAFSGFNRILNGPLGKLVKRLEQLLIAGGCGGQQLEVVSKGEGQDGNGGHFEGVTEVAVLRGVKCVQGHLKDHVEQHGGRCAPLEHPDFIGENLGNPLIRPHTRSKVRIVGADRVLDLFWHPKIVQCEEQQGVADTPVSVRKVQPRGTNRALGPAVILQGFGGQGRTFNAASNFWQEALWLEKKAFAISSAILEDREKQFPLDIAHCNWPELGRVATITFFHTGLWQQNDHGFLPWPWDYTIAPYPADNLCKISRRRSNVCTQDMALVALSENASREFLERRGVSLKCS